MAASLVASSVELAKNGKGAELPKDCRGARPGRSRFDGKSGVLIGS